ncbi:hypothetical protein OROMI_019291 [Orobanche minor]
MAVKARKVTMFTMMNIMSQSFSLISAGGPTGQLALTHQYLACQCFSYIAGALTAIREALVEMEDEFEAARAAIFHGYITNIV